MIATRCNWRLGIKRACDLLLALVFLILLGPFILLLAFAVRMESPGNPFFLQQRVGHLSKPFTLYKLRTMYKHRSGIVLGVEVHPGDDRVTRMGRYLRRFKLDELPQLLNVVMGHMSFVGPRPDLPMQAAVYTSFQRQRLKVRPGLTGIAQTSGNIHLSWAQRIVLDVWYIQNWSFRLDVRIVWHTLAVILYGEKADADPLDLRPALFADSANHGSTSPIQGGYDE